MEVDPTDPGLPGDWTRDGRTINGYLERRQRRLSRAYQAEKSDRNKKAAAFVEAAVVQAIETPYDDPEFERALHTVAHAVKHLLTPQALGYLEGTLSSDERAGAIRWRELGRLELWLQRAALPVGSNARKLTAQRGFTEGNTYRLAQALKHPHRLFELGCRAPGRTTAAVYNIARRAQVSPKTVVAALLIYGLERMADVLRQAREVTPLLTQEQSDLYPEAPDV